MVGDGSVRKNNLGVASQISHNKLCDMATNLDVNTKAIEELMQLGQFRSKREAVDAAVQEAILYRKQLKALELLGTVEFILPSSGAKPGTDG